MKQRLISLAGFSLALLLFGGQVDAEAMANTRFATRLSYGRPGYRPEYLVGFRVVRTIDAK